MEAQRAYNPVPLMLRLVWSIWLIWFVLFIWFVSFNQKPDRPDKPHNSLFMLADWFSFLLENIRSLAGTPKPPHVVPHTNIEG